MSTQDEVAAYIESLIRRTSPFQEDAGRVFVTTDNGQRVELPMASTRVESRSNVRSRRANAIAPEVRDIGPLWGVDIYGYHFGTNYAVYLRETGKQIIITPPSMADADFPVIDVDRKGVSHTFICTGYSNDVARRALVSHGRTILDLNFSKDVAIWRPSAARLCNGHLMTLPLVFLGGNIDSATMAGFAFNVRDVSSAADVDFFDFSFEGTGTQGAAVGISLGRLTISGEVPAYPGGPRYPFYYNYLGRANSVKTATYSTLPPVTNEPPTGGEGDLSNSPIKKMVFPLIGGIIVPRVIIVNAFEIFVEDAFLGLISTIDWLGRAVFENGVITVELRTAFYGDFVLESAELVGEVARVIFAESTCNATYTLPLLSDLDNGLVILEQFDGTVYKRSGNENEDSTTQATANERYTTESGVHRTFLVGPNGEKPIDPSWQHSFYIPSSTIERGQDVAVGQVLTMQLQPLSGYVDSYVNWNHPDISFPRNAGMILGVPGNSYGQETWKNSTGDWGSYKTRVTRNTPRPDHAAALAEKLAPGAKVYGIIYSNGKTKPHRSFVPQALSTVFKGVITASSHTLMPAGSVVSPQYYSWSRTFHRMDAGALFHIGGLSFKITEILSDQIVSGGWEFFGDFYWGKIPFSDTRFHSFSGNVFLDGSLRNIFPTEASSAAQFAHAGTAYPIDVFSEGVFEDTLAGTRLIWDDPYIWRQRRYYTEAGHWEGYVEGKESHPCEVPRWKLDYSGPDVKCWFDGIEYLTPKAPIKGGSVYCDEVQDLNFDLRTIRENLER